MKKVETIGALVVYGRHLLAISAVTDFLWQLAYFGEAVRVRVCVCMYS